MFKFTVYRKVNMSRNFFLIILLVCFIAVGGKMVLANEKITTYEEAMRLFQKGDLVAAEKKFQAARLNVSVSDHNQDIDLKLSILSPIKEVMEDLDEKSSNYYDGNKLQSLVNMYDRWQDSQNKWGLGTAVQKDMYGEMLAITKLDKDMEGYFSNIKNTQLAKLANNTANDSTKEEGIYKSLQLIPVSYYGGDSSKIDEIKSAFLNYYNNKLNKLTEANADVSTIVTEGNRQFGMSSQFSIPTDWLEETLNSHFVKVLTEALENKDYAAFAGQASSVKNLSSKMADAKVFPFIEKSKNGLLNKANNFVAINKYEDAIKIFEALTPLEDTAELIANTNLAWDKYEPIRVLKRKYTDKVFSNFANVRNKWGVDSAVAAISADGGVYYGQLKGEEEMAVIDGRLDGATDSSISTSNEVVPDIIKISLQGSMSSSDNPVIFMEAKATERKHRYIAFEVDTQLSSMKKILDEEADNLTVDSKGVLLLDNPVGTGAGELAYYEPDYNGEYRFTEIKVDYVDIQPEDIEQYNGQKVRFSAYVDSLQNDGALVKLSETYNYNTSQYERTYLLLKGQSEFVTYYNYTVIGTFNSYQTITDEDGQSVRVPVVQVEKVE
ncbi:hypothetical protein [Neobacillus vireti]|uniref:hypothetical protein n=1 Tax=Neobacillus vireti TaxID=220686 RepID=UPI002FFE56E6